jgi:hypothetical protein
MGPKTPKEDPEAKAAATKQRNRANEQAQSAQADRVNEQISVSRAGRRELMFGPTGALGVTSPLGVR